ncbi:NADP-specific glutamate dehydrogenase [Taylorella equigenitalis]|uniref:Glutamate dehydrogenase n=3 Tax=Taylorella equigenitalis TaxID=29575 RepID=A0A654KFF4_TAYEM|nr:NADP-specific glutamate dehydrogenase [Taylorella equigenitalis]ADU91141.1 NADP-specific glutamate dehydrogenase [Taylorella equigenitalis MCE9]AFN36246.1 glutamate dehydrogenase [Taylorella equigenitalis ATCC 35865]ASY30817.1 glutamate dehydrogenase [Taylorella equigenitalis]ASY38118.1 NADP-specific glutamate dehydrogenase [Taylorella equigenitalis]ASY39645.1 glutamate dehydrogenase [Taylorella equigenitalis]
MSNLIEQTLNDLKKSSPAQPEFYQAVEEVVESLEPLFKKEKKYQENNILQRIVEPERQIFFRVSWIDDKGQVQVNKGFRVQFNSAIGPYKGGLRFHPSVNAGIIKFLGFEQIFKNALTGLPIGGAKGGSNFDPKGKSDNEIMRFCQSFMTELYRHIGDTIDIPAGDIGVGAREIGYLYGQYKRLTGKYEGVLTGKALNWGGSLARPEATGFGCVYFAQNMLKAKGDSLEGKTALVSGAGNVAMFTVKKLIELGAKPVTCSDSRGFIYHEAGINFDTLAEIKSNANNSLEEYAKRHSDAKYTPKSSYPEGNNPLWDIKCDLAFPCATQNEINLEDAKNLIKNGCKLVSEGANMPSTAEAAKSFLDAGLLYGPAKAANAGGVAVSQLEMAQNASMSVWTFDEVDNRLKGIMSHIYNLSAQTAEEFGQPDNLILGSNIAGFRKVADSMIAQGAL